MIKNYFITAIRTLFKNKLNSLINLSGLAMGIAISIFIYLYIRVELSYEKEYPDYKLVYRLASRDWAKSSPSESEEIQKYFPEISLSGRFAQFGSVVVVNNRHFPAWDGYVADPSILRIFSRKVLSGNENDCLVRPYTLVLTRSTVKKWFGNENPVGKTLKFAQGRLSEQPEFEITAVIEDFPSNSHLRIGYMISMSSMYKEVPEQWMQSRSWKVTYTYLLFKNHEEVKRVAARLKEFQLNYLVNGDRSKENIDKTRERIESGDSYELHPLTEIHLFSHREQEMGANGDILSVYIFGGLAILIIIVASTNYINIFITQALKRSKEVGIRKVSGAYRGQLITQFLTESFISTLIASLFAIILCMIGLPLFNSIASQNYSIGDLLSLKILAGISGLVLVVGFLSGSYPAYFIAGFSISQGIKLNQVPRSSLANIRKLLIIFQFVIAIFMIISTLIIKQQLNYLRKKELGFDKDYVMAFHSYGDMSYVIHEKRKYIYDQFLKNPSILNVGATSNLVGDIQSVEFLMPDGKQYDPLKKQVVMRFMRADEGFLPTFGLTLLAGRNFNPTSDSAGAFIINQKTAEALNLENPVGTMASNGNSGIHGQIVGVVKDFNFASLHNPIEPLVIEYKPLWTSILVAKLDGKNLPETLKYVENLFKDLAPGTMFTYEFIDEKLNSMYQSEDKMSKIFNIFSFLAILISCLGLYGLAAWSAELRTGEIGIRKAFGASVGKILIMLSRTYLGMLIVALIIAIPVSNYFITEWLKSFTYHIIIHWWVFVLSGIIVICVAMIAVTGRSYFAARANPADSLRTE